MNYIFTLLPSLINLSSITDIQSVIIKRNDRAQLKDAIFSNVLLRLKVMPDLEPGTFNISH